MTILVIEMYFHKYKQIHHYLLHIIHASTMTLLGLLALVQASLKSIGMISQTCVTFLRPIFRGLKKLPSRSWTAFGGIQLFLFSSFGNHIRS